MIYLDGLSSIIECVYLNERLSYKPPQCNIFVNPENVRYLVGKTVIINSAEYDYKNNIPVLFKNNCNIISRIKLGEEMSEVNFHPYILKISKNVNWNGKCIEEQDTINKILDENHCEFDISDYKLYFPKINIQDNSVGPKIIDSHGNLTCLGWVLQQVGINVREDTPIKNLDVIKTGKIMFG